MLRHCKFIRTVRYEYIHLPVCRCANPPRWKFNAVYVNLLIRSPRAALSSKCSKHFGSLNPPHTARNFSSTVEMKKKVCKFVHWTLANYQICMVEWEIVKNEHRKGDNSHRSLSRTEQNDFGEHSDGGRASIFIHLLYTDMSSLSHRHSK